jgi:hypothetical protein
MSMICEAVIVVGYGSDNDAMETLNAALAAADTERRQHFRRINMDGAGGTKFFCSDVWAGAFNYLPPSTIERAVADAEWAAPEDVVLTIDPSEWEEDVDLRTTTVAALRQRLANEADA